MHVCVPFLQSEALAAIIGRPDSYAGVAEIRPLAELPHVHHPNSAGGITSKASLSAQASSQQQQQQQQRQQPLLPDQQAAAEGRGRATAAPAQAQEEEGWQQAKAPNGWKTGAGASSRDAADKERSRCAGCSVPAGLFACFCV